MFAKAENPKDGSSLALPRRLARSARRRLDRRSERLQRIRYLFVQHGLIEAEYIDKIFLTSSGRKDPWQIRAEGLDKLLTGEELARALYHIAKHRGFKSSRKIEVGDKKSEEGKLLEGVKRTGSLLNDKGYRTVGEMFFQDESFAEQKRNRQGAYLNTVERSLLEAEIREIFRCQREFDSSLVNHEFETEFLENFNWQKSFASGDDILRLIGKCTFEGASGELRAPRNAYTSERFTLLSAVNNLSLLTNNGTVFLTPEQRQIVINLAYASPRVDYARLRKVLNLEDDIRFASLSYYHKCKGEEVDKFDCEKKVFAQLFGYHEMRKAFERAGKWEIVKIDPDILDTIAEALTFYKTDEDITKHLKACGLTDDMVDIAMGIGSFIKVKHLSIKAMRRIIPYLEDGDKYHEACTKAGYDHSRPQSTARQDRLPPIGEEIRNPVVLRSLSQARKVVNAIIERYNAPYAINVEMARDMSRTADERKEIEKRQEENRQARDIAKEDVRKHYAEFFSADNSNPANDDVLKWLLYREQSGQCAYSLHPFDLSRLLEPGYAEIDHIIPYSRSFDDSRSNKILVRGVENRNKQNLTPFEYFGADKERWEEFEGWVKVNIKDIRKRQKLLKLSVSNEEEQEWKERNLNDTRYITRYFSNFITGNLKFADDAPAVPVCQVNGQVTGLLRAKWGLVKNREESDLHHALDAAIVTTISRSLIQRITNYRKDRETGRVGAGEPYVDPETGEIMEFRRDWNFAFPEPWVGFRSELLARLSSDPISAISALGPVAYRGKGDISPIFVSRMPIRKVSGQAHKETIKSKKYLQEGFSVVKKPLNKLKMQDLDKIFKPESDRCLYEEIRKRLEQYDGDGAKAFKDPLYKPTRDAGLGPLVRSIKICTPQNSGVAVNGGVAGNGDMVRIDIFAKEGKYYLVPIYVADFVREELPNRAIVAHTSSDKWVEINENHNFCFSLYPYDLVHIMLKDGTDFMGYYITCDSNTGAIRVCPQDKHTETSQQRFGIKTARLIEKYEVGILGDVHKVKGEIRRGVENCCHSKPGASVG